jgi:PhzF family phenazine biosynthesis protein
MKKQIERIPLYQVDAFTDKRFKGNPAAVCLLKSQHNDEVLQLIAAEMNLSETAFLHNKTEEPFEKSGAFSLRWFTPETEVPLCGHATLASAAVLFYDVPLSTDEIVFDTRSGKLAAKKENGKIILDFPSNEPVPTNPDQELLKAVGVTEFENTLLSKQTKDLLIHMPDEKSLLNLKPNFEQMKSISTTEGIWGVIVTSRGHPPYDFTSRFFAPWLGINEDPVTGAAHTVLAPYWSKIFKKKEMRAYQASPRGGEMKLRIRSNNRVDLIGNAVIISKGELYL